MLPYTLSFSTDCVVPILTLLFVAFILIASELPMKKFISTVL